MSPNVSKGPSGKGCQTKDPAGRAVLFSMLFGSCGSPLNLSGLVEFKLKDCFSLSLPKCTQLQLSAPCDVSAHAKLESQCT